MSAQPGAGGHRPGGAGWDLLAELGMNQHHFSSGSLLSSDPGATGSISYGGLRAGIDWSFGRLDAVAHPTLGLWAFARVELEERGTSYRYTETGFFSGSQSQNAGAVTLGGGAEVGLALAGGFDLLP